ncbi:MAG: hypothetical protein GY716_25130 [bacterium]|nr:hypothetical protein [bacterium]
MRSPYSPQLTASVVAFVLVLAWVTVPVLNELGSSRIKIGILGVTGLVLLAVYLRNARRSLADRRAGRAATDEFTRAARLNAGHAAFMMSLVLWSVIFVAQGQFESTRTMLGTGILGQCGIYGICLVFFHRAGSLHEDAG